MHSIQLCVIRYIVIDYIWTKCFCGYSQLLVRVYSIDIDFYNNGYYGQMDKFQNIGLCG